MQRLNYTAQHGDDVTTGYSRVVVARDRGTLECGETRLARPPPTKNRTTRYQVYTKKKIPGMDIYIYYKN